MWGLSVLPAVVHSYGATAASYSLADFQGWQFRSSVLDMQRQPLPLGREHDLDTSWSWPGLLGKGARMRWSASGSFGEHSRIACAYLVHLTSFDNIWPKSVGFQPLPSTHLGMLVPVVAHCCAMRSQSSGMPWRRLVSAAWNDDQIVPACASVLQWHRFNAHSTSFKLVKETLWDVQNLHCCFWLAAKPWFHPTLLTSDICRQLVTNCSNSADECRLAPFFLWFPRLRGALEFGLPGEVEETWAEHTKLGPWNHYIMSTCIYVYDCVYITLTYWFIHLFFNLLIYSFIYIFTYLFITSVMCLIISFID